MNKAIPQSIGLTVLLLFFHIVLFGQLQVSTDKEDAMYQIGETISFQIRSNASGSANYKIIYDDRSAAIETGTINLVANQTYNLSYTHSKAGVVSCSVSGPGGAGLATATIEPFNITPLEPEPSDFDQYWNTQKSLVNALSNSASLPVHSNNAQSVTYALSLPNVDGRRIYGYMTVPNGSGPFPATIIFPAFGSTAGAVSPQIDVAERGGLITICLSVHNAPVTQADPNAYRPNDPSNRDKIYMRYALTGAMNVINYLESRSDFDQQNVCAMGVSQGGGLAMLLAGIDDRVNLLIHSNPSMNEHQGFKYDQASGFPYYLETSGGSSAVSTAVKYYDAMYASKRFKGPSYSLIGLQDMIVPSATSLAGFNQLSGERVLMVSRDGGHGHPGEYWNGRFEFLRRHYQLTPPFQFAGTTKGYSVDAGAPVQTASSDATVSASVQFESQSISNLSAQWTKVSGPGNVGFANPSAYSTTASFSQAGTYVLRFIAQDNKNLSGEGKIYFLADDVVVTVGEGGGDTGGGDTGGGDTGGGDTGGGDTTGTLTIDCPSDINQTASAGQTTASVSWTVPSATSTCDQGGGTGTCSTTMNGFSYLGKIGQSNYFLSNVPFQWTAAKADAQQNGGVLAKIENKETNDLIQTAGDIVYIGLSDEASEGNFIWTDGSAPSYTNYQSDASNTDGNDYIVVNPWDGSWAYYSQFVAKKYVLEVPCESTSGGGGAPSVTQIGGPSRGSSFPIGTTTVSYQATDDCGNTRTCSFDVTITASTTSLSLNCPTNRQVQLDGGDTRERVDWEIPVGNTNCPNGATTNQLSGPTPNSNLSAGSYTVEYEATDNCGNTDNCSFTISIQETATALSINCPSNKQVQLSPGDMDTRVDWQAAEGATNCPSGATVKQLSGPSPNTNLTEGFYTIWYEATDNCGNRATCSFTIDVKSSPTNLSLNCPEDISVQLNTGENSRAINWADPVDTGSCPGSVTINQTGGPNAGNQLSAGNYQVNYEANDNCNNTATCTFSISITDGPIVDPPSTINLDCTGNIIADLNSNESGKIVYWNDPTLTTNCTIGGTSNGTCAEETLSGFSYIGEFEGSRYYKSTVASTWLMAKAATEAQGGRLISIETEAENNYINEQIDGGYLYIGLNDYDNEGTFTWADGATPSYTNYEPNQGNSTSKNNYLFNAWSGTWTLISNAVYGFYIMEIPCGGGSTGTSTITQTRGPSSGSYLSAGVTTISYAATDACGKTTTCSFTITLNASGPTNPPINSTGECMIQAQSVSLINGITIGGSTNNLIDGSGLSNETRSAQHESGQLYNGVWLNDGTKPILDFDLGTVRTINGLLLWNYSYHTWLVLKRRGVKNFAISVSENGVNYSSETNFTTAASTESGQAETSQLFTLPSPVNARYVRMRVLNAKDDGRYVGLGEIRFTNGCASESIQEEVGLPNSSFRTASASTDLVYSDRATLQIAPNPSKGNFTIALPSGIKEAINVTIYNEIGKEIYQTMFEAGVDQYQIDLQQQPKGVYLIRAHSPSINYKLQKIIIQ